MKLMSRLTDIAVVGRFALENCTVRQNDQNVIR